MSWTRSELEVGQGGVAIGKDGGADSGMMMHCTKRWGETMAIVGAGRRRVDHVVVAIGRPSTARGGDGAAGGYCDGGGDGDR